MAIEFVVRNEVADGDLRTIVFFWLAAVVAVVVVYVVEMRRFRAAPAVVVELTLASDNLRLRTGALGNEGAVTIRGDRDVPVLRIETLEVVEAVDIFLDLAIESREVILSLGVLNPDVESSFGLDSGAFEREEVERTGKGGGRSVCYVTDEGTVFAMFSRIVDA